MMQNTTANDSVLNPAMSNTHAAAAKYHGLGYRPLPIPAKKKGPCITGWPKYQFDEATAARYFPDGSNIGIILGAGLVCVDLDHQTVLELAKGILPPTGCVIGRPGRPRCHWFYRVEGKIETTHFKVKVLTDQGKAKLNLMDLLAVGSQVVVGPSVHPTGDIYDSLEGEPGTIDSGTLLEAVTNLFNQAKAVLVANGLEIVEDTKPLKKLASPVVGAPLRACPAGEAPGTAFNREHPGGLLIRHGWSYVGDGDDKEHWRRPGKDEGSSATLSTHNGGWQFYNFSSNANLPQDENLSPHALLAHLEHDGDFTQAAKALRALGYGAKDADGDLSGILGGGKPVAEEEAAEPPEDLTFAPPPIGALPKPIRLGGCVGWRVDEIKDWLAAGLPNREKWFAIVAASKKAGR